MSPLEEPSIGPGTRLGPYGIMGLLDAGGMGVVYRRATRVSIAFGCLVQPPVRHASSPWPYTRVGISATR